MPYWVDEVAARLYTETKLFDRVPDQAIVNEYRPGQGIALHADRQCFGDTVATLSWAMIGNAAAACEGNSEGRQGGFCLREDPCSY